MTNFHIYKASAGSGKTYTLVKEYIEKCLANNSKISHQSLLAITFTNKAASEMKSRIINTLFEFTHGFDKIPDTSSRQLYNDLKLKLNYTDLELIKKSKKALSDIIHYYSLFSVSTIDKFIHKIIRGFSYELDLSSNFEVEMEYDKMIQDGVWTILDEIGTDKSITDNLLKYSLYKTQQNKNWDIEEDLLKISTHLFKEHKAGFINKLPDSKKIKKEQRELISRIKHFESQLNSIRVDVEKIISGIPDNAFLYKDLPNYLHKISVSPYLNIVLSNRFKESILNKKWYKKSASTHHKEQVDDISDLLHDKLMDLVTLINTEYPHYLFYKQCYNSFFSVAVLKNIDEKIESIKQENNTVHISEFNQLILKFLTKNPIPFIYEKIGTRYNHYFIDEFQDTSIIQWNNLIPLVQEALSIGGSCLIVGDGKQSIYRWRGGDVGQFLLLCNSEEAHPMSQFSAQIQSLNINYRSSKNIVDFNNKFFSFLSKHLVAPYQNLYNTLNQKSSSKMGGYVEVSGLSLKGEEVVEKTLELIYNRIMSALNDGYQFSDICILTRSNKEIAKLASYLTDQDIPIISSESLLLKKSPVVHFLINNLSIIFDETDFLSKAKVLEYLINNHIIDTGSVSKHSLIYDYANVDNLKFESFLKMSGVVWPVKTYRRLNLYEIIENLIRVFSLNKSPSIYINFFLDFIYDFSIKRNSSIKDFLNFWDQKKDVASIVIPNGINAVELMTIHKSKGLQFPVVIFPFANWKEDLGTDNTWFNVGGVISKTNPEKELLTLLPLKKELENWPTPFPNIYKKHKNAVRLDNINLLYVAMTRPKDRLYIITNADPKRE